MTPTGEASHGESDGASNGFGNGKNLRDAAMKLLAVVLSPMRLEKVNEIREADDDFKANGSKRGRGGPGGPPPGGQGGPPPGGKKGPGCPG